MKFFVTGVNGQLSHDVMNELNKRWYEGIGSDLKEVYSGVLDGSAVTTMPYMYSLTLQIKRLLIRPSVIPVTTKEYGLSKAARPSNSRLDKSKLVAAGFKPLQTWQDAVSRYLKESNL